MKKVLAFVLALAMMLGLCGTALAVTQEELIGVWNMDMSAMAAMTGGMDEDMEAMAPLLALMTGTMEFTAEGNYKLVMSFMGEEEVQEGTYAVTADGKLSMDGSAGANAVVENDVLTITEEDMVLSFTRSTGEAEEASQEDQMSALLALMNAMQTEEEAADETEAVVAAGAGKLEAKQQNIHFVESYAPYVYGYAKVENVGDAEIQLDDCLLQVYDEAGTLLTMKDYGDANAAYLKPGEYTYLAAYTDVDEGTAAKAELSFTSSKDMYYTNNRLPVTTDLQLNVEEGWRTRNYMFATITNDTDAPVYDMEVVLALLDAEGNILYVQDKSFYDCSIVPGDSLIVRLDIESDFMEYFAANNLVPASVDAIAFVEVETSDW